MQPCLYRKVRDGRWFDYVLVRGAVDPFRDDPQGPRWKPKGKTAKFTLFEKDPSRPDRLDGPEGPCVGLRRPGTSEAIEAAP